MLSAMECLLLNGNDFCQSRPVLTSVMNKAIPRICHKCSVGSATVPKKEKRTSPPTTLNIRRRFKKGQKKGKGKGKGRKASPLITMKSILYSEHCKFYMRQNQNIKATTTSNSQIQSQKLMITTPPGRTLLIIPLH